MISTSITHLLKKLQKQKHTTCTSIPRAATKLKPKYIGSSCFGAISREKYYLNTMSKVNTDFGKYNPKYSSITEY